MNMRLGNFYGPWSLSCWLRKKIHELFSNFDFFREFRVRFPALSGFEWSYGRVENKVSGHRGGVVTGSFELLRVTN